MRNRSLIFRPVVWLCIGGLTALFVWLLAIASLSPLLLFPLVGLLFLGLGLLDYFCVFKGNRPNPPIEPAETNTMLNLQIKASPLSQNSLQDPAPFKEHYRLLEMLACGRFGKTYVAEDLTARPKKLWVIKHFIPQPEHDRDLQTTQRLFKGEASTLEKLKGLECIPKLLNYFENEKEIWFIREYIIGNPLNEEIIIGKPLSEVQVIDILKGILQGLEAIHQFQIIHRDIKPSNIIRRKIDRSLILIDFGAAKKWNPQEESKPMMTVAVGTASYTSYEQMLGQPVPSSDIYSAGVIGIEAITGLEPSRIPLSATGEYRWREHAKVSPKLANILDKMTRTSVKHRYQTATAVLADLGAL